jgi:GH15 family glucan-1,4-alpha-glucosidase
MDERIAKVWEKSKMVIRDCVIENGAIVAANPTKAYYSNEAKHYFYVWPRDAAFTCMAAKMAGITDIQEPFFDWILDRAEDMDDEGHLHNHYTGLLYEKYYVNGLQALHRFQPDQGGALLFAIADYYDGDGEKAKKYRDLIEGLADGYIKMWDKDHFKSLTNDLWEERHTYPDLKDNFSYALAACAAGLLAADRLYPNEKYRAVADQMKKVLLGSSKDFGYFYRSFGRLNDKNIDASLLGLAWPFEIVDYDNPDFVRTVDLIIEKLAPNDGVYRYEQDEYDGWMYRGFHRKKGAGYWPLLNFWLAIVLSKMGRKEEAERYYNKVLDEMDKSGLIAEQIFDNDIQKAVSPLCWSHVMFLFATKELGYNKQ